MALDKAEQDALADKNTIVIIPDFGAESQICIRWLRKNAPKVITEQRVFSELILSTLQTDVTVMLLARDYSMPIQLMEMDNAGNMHYPNRPDDQLLDEVELSAPVRVSKYWVRDNPMRPGRLDISSILEVLGKESSPWRLEFTDKGSDKPEILTLVKG